MLKLSAQCRQFGTLVIRAASVAIIVFAGTQSYAADKSISSLSWMTGSWAGPAGEGVTLEENWATPTGGTIASLVRMTTKDSTPMVELIVIEESEGTLVLNLQQWDPGFSPRTPGPQTMVMSAQSERSVTFTTAGEGGLQTLSYSSPDPESFNIDIITSAGDPIALKLKSVR